VSAVSNVGESQGAELVLLADEGNSVPVELFATRALRLAIERAARVNRGKDPILVSFTSLFIGIIAGNDAVADWTRQRFDRAPRGLDALLGRRGLTLEQLWELSKGDDAAGSERSPLLRSQSVRAALAEAERLARDLGGVPDTRHVLAAYIALPTYHEGDFRRFEIDRQQWAMAFGPAMANAYRKEASFWSSFHDRVFPAGATVTSTDGAQASASPLALGEQRVESHVSWALEIADQLAQSAPITPYHVLRAAIGIAPEALSTAYRRIAALVSLGGAQVPKRHGRPVDATRLSESLRARLIDAQTVGTPREVLWGRDLITAAVLADDPKLAVELDGAGQSVDEVRARWYTFVTSDPDGRPTAEWDLIWQAAGIRTPGPDLAGYSTETDQGEDRLGIDAQALSFARLILDRNVKAPLSIGLLGDWGSGKSFFIERIKAQIDQLTRQGLPEVYEHVIEIEFNAWHASDANLWASLVTAIFDEIWEKVTPLNANGKSEAQQQLLANMEKANGAVHEAEGRVAIARAALVEAENAVAQRKLTLALNDELKTTFKQLAKRAGWHRELETIMDATDALRALGSSGQRLRLAMAAMLQQPLRTVALPTLLLAVATLVIWRLTESKEPLALVFRGVGTLLTAVGALIAPLAAVSSKVNAFAAELEGFQARLKAKEPGGGPITSARSELVVAEARVEAAKQRLAELVNAKAMLNPQRRLGAFLEERVRSSEYRSQQGIISLVHKDFRELSKYMQELRTSPEKHAGTQLRPIERIVLYVDDLDRCRPNQVVHMLEAVHLLLALDLFVVVVAVDARWLARSLEVHYKELLAEDDAEGGDGLRVATAQGYLEKIFQVTYALGPMDPNHFAGYVRSLTQGEEPSTRSVDDDARSGSKEAVRTAQGGAAREASSGAGLAAIAADNGHSPASGAKSDASGATPTRAPTDGSHSSSTPESGTRKRLPPLARPVRITGDEQALLTKLVPLLPTPRVAKRLVNVYRLIKASKNAAELAKFELDDRATSCLTMLAILFGKPSVGNALLRALCAAEAPFDDPQRLLVDAIALRSQRASRPNELDERARWQALHRALQKVGSTLAIGQCAREPLEIARYSLVSGHDWHTWGDARAADEGARREAAKPAS
jgi:hypothetical protein